MGNSCNHEHEEEIEEDAICCTRRGRYLPKYICEYLSSQWFLYILNSKVIQQYLIELFGTEVDLSDTNQQRGRQTRPKHHTYKDHVYLDPLFLLSNLTWRRAHVTAGLTGRDPNVKVNVLRCFRWGQKAWLGKKVDFCSAFEIRLFV